MIGISYGFGNSESSAGAIFRSVTIEFDMHRNISVLLEKDHTLNLGNIKITRNDKVTSFTKGQIPVIKMPRLERILINTPTSIVGGLENMVIYIPFNYRFEDRSGVGGSQKQRIYDVVKIYFSDDVLSMWEICVVMKKEGEWKVTTYYPNKEKYVEIVESEKNPFGSFE